jgi:hypothetical protein
LAEVTPPDKPAGAVSPNYTPQHNHSDRERHANRRPDATLGRRKPEKAPNGCRESLACTNRKARHKAGLSSASEAGSD